MRCDSCAHAENRPCDFGLDGIDPCVRPELEALWAQGIETVCSCCGHGNQDAAFIVVDEAYRADMESQGYAQAPMKYEHCADCGAFFRPKQRMGE